MNKLSPALLLAAMLFAACSTSTGEISAAPTQSHCAAYGAIYSDELSNGHVEFAFNGNSDRYPAQVTENRLIDGKRQYVVIVMLETGDIEMSFSHQEDSAWLVWAVFPEGNQYEMTVVLDGRNNTLGADGNGGQIVAESDDGFGLDPIVIEC